jgi:hypothetical protein
MPPTPTPAATEPRSLRARLPRILVAASVSGASLSGCDFDRTDRWLAEPLGATCEVGSRRCNGNTLESCETGPAGPGFIASDDCAEDGLVCVPALLTCKTCQPNQSVCDGQAVLRCDEDGEQQTEEETCETDAGRACRGGTCTDLCRAATQRRSNVGCEYWAVDLDNARIDDGLNAAAQQFAVVVSNAQPDVPALVRIDRDDGQPGEPNEPLKLAEANLPPLSLQVFKLGPREVDGSPPGQFDAGTHTALSRAAYRVTSSVPVVAYQFNPLENVNVFSNDASLLKPVEALRDAPGTMLDAYVAVGWPQTIASTDDPNTNFDPNSAQQLRAFLTLVGTRSNTRVRVTTRAPVVAGGPIEETPAGGAIEAVLEPFDVLNLETGDFGADFTGSVISANQPLVVFTGSEASDAPFFRTLSERRCCADHLEEQLDPIRTAGRVFVATVSPNRTAALRQAGATVGEIPQVEYFRVIAVTEAGARLRTTLPGRAAGITLPGRGDFVQIESTEDFVIASDAPVVLSSVSPSQADAGVPPDLPGGDPSLLIVPPVEQYRSSYVFLTPDKYDFDFIRVIAPPATRILLDGEPIEGIDTCRRTPALDASSARELGVAEFSVYRCQLGFPSIDPLGEPPDNVRPGRQNDGVHTLEAERPVGVLVDGFDSFVSYAYAAGTELAQIVSPE